MKINVDGGEYTIQTEAMNNGGVIYKFDLRVFVLVLGALRTYAAGQGLSFLQTVNDALIDYCHNKGVVHLK